MKLKCPICGKPVNVGDSFMPFCSDRCKLIDLGNWASEKYKIEGPASPQDLETAGQENGEE
jgi:endogenous inhibitor of DNA gyrase (YacG/DUF329 family)